jgi:hypothetical protein
VKLLYLTTAYAAFARQFYAPDSGRADAGFAAQRAALEAEGYGWAGAWGPALAPHGIEVCEVWLNLEPMQRAWSREHGGPGPASALADLAVARARAFAPDVLWYDHGDEALLSRLRDACPSIRTALGWVGSALPDRPVWSSFDLVLSCAPESIEVLRRRGVRAELLHHAFHRHVLERLSPGPFSHDVCFVGQLDPDHPLHEHRERILDALLARFDLAVFAHTPSQAGGRGRRAVKRAAWHAAHVLRRTGVPEGAIRRLPVIGRAAAWPGAPRVQLPPRLARALKPPRFGLAMYQLLRDARITLNVHAGPETRFTSNMRLFEATGVGSCLLTDAAENLPELFQPDREVATFRTVEECVEQVARLLERDDERTAVARAGQARCLAEHTYERRGVRLAELVRSALP